MFRLACVWIADLPLQILCVRCPEWSGKPVAVIARDAPQAEILYLNPAARRAGVRPGMRYAAALGLAPQLHAGTVSPEDIAGCIALLSRRMRAFTPDVEPDAGEPGVFYLNAGGLTGLFGAETAWSKEVWKATRSEGFTSSIAVGFTRFGTYAAAKTRKGESVFASPEHERKAALAVSLNAFGLLPDTAQELSLLGINTVEDLLRLPVYGLRLRYGEQVFRLYKSACGDLWQPLQADAEKPLHERRMIFDTPERDTQRLCRFLEKMLTALAGEVEKKGELIRSIHWTCTLDTGLPYSSEVTPSNPTGNIQRLMELVHLRIEAEPPPSAVEEIVLSAQSSPAYTVKRDLFDMPEPRNRAAGERALARIRAAFGDDAVVTAHLADEYLPERSFHWNIARSVPVPNPCDVSEEFPYMRRIYAVPQRLPDEYRQSGNRVVGEYRISGDWWSKKTVREYRFILTNEGRLLWVYYDYARADWFIQGEVE
ncbi:MAG: DNA polymerase IV [Candidatus Latescibacteria bacterium ADurb.Bin168]|nr:MAG: DNA polymerase IV [Candidatus Latescibacteria bacterium ADurb.Bin168]